MKPEMNLPRIGIIVGSTRPGRLADRVLSWLLPFTERQTDLSFETLDLRDFSLPFFEEAASNAYLPTKNEAGQRWQQTLEGFDGYIFLTAEYNHAPTAVLKNALDYAYPEWARKPAAFVGYGGVGGARAVEQLRQIATELQMAPLRNAVHIAGGDFVSVARGERQLSELEYLNPSAELMLTDLSWWASALKSAREG